MLRCNGCGGPVVAGCRGNPGADGSVATEVLDDGSARTVAYHWRRACSGRLDGRRWSVPTRALSLGAPMLAAQVEPLRRAA